jgi:7-cyano-7-deazaguanine synthase
MNCVALLSGGLDSTVATALAHRDGGVALALTVDYGQRGAAAEVKAARAIARELRIRHRTVRLDFLSELATSALLDANAELPTLSPAQLDDTRGAAQSSMRGVWVPNRNGLLIAIAAAFAEGLRADRVVVGFNREEAATFPDNTAEFVERSSRALELSTLNGVRVVAPTAALDKEGIVRRGVEVGAPLALVWPCYRGGPALCRRCESCLRFLRALERAGLAATFVSEWDDQEGQVDA